MATSLAVSSTTPPSSRLGYIGGSDAASILGVSPWKTRYQLWCEKTGAEPPPDMSAIEYVYWGIRLEELVASEFAKRCAKKIRRSNRLAKHKKHKFLAGHVDRLILGERAFVECKTSNAFDYRKWGPSEGGPEAIPEHYLAQVDHYMMVLDCTHCYVAVLIGGNEFRWYQIKRDAKREALMLTEELKFWDLVTRQDPPEVITEQDAKHRWKQVLEGTSVAVDLDARKRIMRLSDLTTKLKDFEKEEEELRNWLFPLFQDKEVVAHQGVPLARLTVYTRNYFDKGALEKKNPKLAKRFTSLQVSKRLKLLI